MPPAGRGGLLMPASPLRVVLCSCALQWRQVCLLLTELPMGAFVTAAKFANFLCEHSQRLLVRVQ